MSNNMRLLSQSEIDTLVEFLSHKGNVNGQVLDQKSIDILVSVLQDQNLARKMQNISKPDSIRTILPSWSQALLLDEEGDLNLQQANCRLLFEEKPDGTIDVICKNIITGKCYSMTPACLDTDASAEEQEATWGKAIVPILFDSIAALLQVGYQRSTFVAVCERYAEVMYGNREQTLPSIYMPSGNQLMQHMLADEA